MKHDKVTQAILDKIEDNTAKQAWAFPMYKEITVKEPEAWPFPTSTYWATKKLADAIDNSVLCTKYLADNNPIAPIPLGPQVNLTDEQKAQITGFEVNLSDYTEKDPNGLNLNSPGAKADAGKNRVWLFLAGFSNALEEVAKVTTIGANKYTPNGWVDVPEGQSRYMDAFGRHLLKLGTGEVFDEPPLGTGCYHKAAMIWNLLAAFELELREEKV